MSELLGMHCESGGLKVEGKLVCWIIFKEEGSLRGYLCTERQDMVLGYENNFSGQSRQAGCHCTFPGRVVGTIEDIQRNSGRSDTNDAG
jgi:hypothetical protein